MCVWSLLTYFYFSICYIVYIYVGAVPATGCPKDVLKVDLPWYIVMLCIWLSYNPLTYSFPALIYSTLDILSIIFSANFYLYMFYIIMLEKCAYEEIFRPFEVFLLVYSPKIWYFLLLLVVLLPRLLEPLESLTLLLLFLHVVFLSIYVLVFQFFKSIFSDLLPFRLFFLRFE